MNSNVKSNEIEKREKIFNTHGWDKGVVEILQRAYGYFKYIAPQQQLKITKYSLPRII